VHELQQGDTAVPYQSNHTLPAKFPVAVSTSVVTYSTTVVMVEEKVVIVSVVDPSSCGMVLVRVGGLDVVNQLMYIEAQ
jgi:hypothetical protein